MEEISGLIPLRKEGGMTSQNAVTRLKHLYGVRKAGHTGTLDPMAEGVLPVLLGRAVKASEFLLEGDKHYRATLLLGIATDTEDSTGQILQRSEALPRSEEVEEACAAFRGEILQIPPMYSAIRVGGRRLMELAREGKTVERQPRPVCIYRLDVGRLDERRYLLDVHCSKGTYIRTLCADIGRRLGCFGVMEHLVRTEAAGFPLSACCTLGELEALPPEKRLAMVRPVDTLFASCPAVTLPAFYARLARNGQEIYLKKIGRTDPPGTRLRLYDGQTFFAMAEVGLYPDGAAARPIRQF